MAISSHVPSLNPDLVLRLKCQSVPVNRNSLPVVAASVGVASIGLSESVALLYLIACSVWIPVINAARPGRVKLLRTVERKTFRI